MEESGLRTQVALGFKGKSTGDTGVRPLARVRPDVFLQHAGLGTPSPAVRTDMLPRSGRVLPLPPDLWRVRIVRCGLSKKKQNHELELISE